MEYDGSEVVVILLDYPYKMSSLKNIWAEERNYFTRMHRKYKEGEH